MNDQDRLSPEHRAQLTALLLKGQLLERDKTIIELETRLFNLEVQKIYGNPPERIQVQPDGTLIRVPPAEEPPKGDTP